MIDATKFARPSAPTPYADGVQRSFRFGGDNRQDMAAELHRFADGVANGSILLQSVQSGQRASVDDWALQALYLEFAEAAEVPAHARGRWFTSIIDLTGIAR